MKAKELIGLLHGLEDFDLKYCGITTEILDALKARPVVHGHWIVRRGNYNEEFECSVCRHISKDGGNYCDNCGARMDGGKR